MISPIYSNCQRICKLFLSKDDLNRNITSISEELDEPDEAISQLPAVPQSSIESFMKDLQNSTVRQKTLIEQ